jgi:PAS domain S-box-containing protein
VKLRVLMAEDSEHDAELVLRELRRGGYDLSWHRVETAELMRAALQREQWDLVLSDWSMPKFSALGALEVLKETELDIPIIILSGTIGEDTATQALRAGAHDFLLKDRLARLLPAVDRELREAAVRKKRSEAEQALKASDARFRTLVESMDDMIFTLDSQLRLDGVFGRWAEVWGHSQEHVIGKTMREILGDEADPHEAAIRQASTGKRVLYEFSMAAPHEDRCFQTALSPIRSSQGAITGLVGVAREITEQRRVQAQLVVSDRLASVGMLAAGVAHEVNNPLTAVVANIDLAIRDLRSMTSQGATELNDVVDELEDARASAERIREIARDLRLFSRAEEEKRGPVDLHRVLESSLRMAWNEIRHRARLVKEYRDRPIVDGNESRLGQVFLNLIMNAVQAIPLGHVDQHEIRVTTRFDTFGWAEVEIKDSGSGMPPEVLKRLFTPFFTTKPAGVGTGLGLSICQRIVSAHGGEIRVESTVDVGTSFTIRLPCGTSEAVTWDVSQHPTPGATSRARIMVIDDEAAIVAVVKRLLTAEHDVTGTDDAHSALERITGGEQYAVILCDVMMPKMSGIDFFKKLQSVAPAQAEKLIFLTGGAFTPDVREFLDTVSNLRIDKPFDPMSLRALINDRLKD